MNKLKKQLAKKYGRPLSEIERITNSPFKFTMNVMIDINDNRTIFFHHLFKFKKKIKYINDKSQEL